MLPVIVFSLICSFLSENSWTWQLLHPHLPPLGQSRNYIWQMRQGTKAMVDWSDGEGEGCVQGSRKQEPEAFQYETALQPWWSHFLLGRSCGATCVCCCWGWEAWLKPPEDQEIDAMMWRWWNEKYTRTQKCIHAYIHDHIHHCKIERDREKNHFISTSQFSIIKDKTTEEHLTSPTSQHLK